MANPAPVLAGSDGIDNILKLLQTLNPMIGGQKDTTQTGGSTSATSETSSLNPETSDQANALLKNILGSTNPDDIDNMIKGIMDNAKTAFGPAAIESNFSGVRGYSDTTLAMVRDNAMAKATAQAAQAKLGAINDANKTATQLVDAKMANTRSVAQVKNTAPTTSTTSKGSSTLGNVASIAGIAAFGNSMLKKKGLLGSEDTGPEQLSGPTGVDSQAMNDQAFSSSPDGSINNAALSAGGDPNTLLGTSRDELQALADGGLTTNAVDANGSPIADASANAGTAAVDGASMTASQAAAVETATNGAITAEDARTIGPIGVQKAMEAQGLNPINFDKLPPEEADAVDILPSDSANNIQLAFANTGTTTDVTAGITEEATNDAALETAGEFALPPGAFTIANAATGGELGDAINDVAGGVDSVIQDIPVVGPIVDSAENAAKDIFSAFDDCFITTAATKGGEADNGRSLTVMRRFRDTYMEETEERRNQVNDYYDTAPIIVQRINARPDADAIWQKLQKDYLEPTVILVEANRMPEAHKSYNALVDAAKEFAQGAN